MGSLTPIEVRTHGESGARVVVLHGGPGARGSVHGLAKHLAKRFRVLEPLQRRSGDRPLTVQRHVEDLHAVLGPWAGDDPVALVGWSWGAMLALAYATAHPGDAAALALVGCGTFDVAARDVYRATVRDRLAGELQGRLDGIDREAAEGALTADARLTRKAEVFESLQSFDALPDDGEPVDVDARGHQESWDDMLARQGDGTYPESFTSIHVPVLMLHGDFDPHPGSLTRDTLVRFVPQLEYRSWRACGHTPWQERQVRDDFLQTLETWLARRVVQEGPGSQGS